MNVSDIRGQVDFGIITIREDEFDAVLQRFPKQDVVQGRRRYNLSEVETVRGDSYLTAVMRCFEQGNTEAMDAARDLLEDLDPQWLLVVGIAGGVPASEFTLGDVVVSTRVYDFSVEAVLQDGSREYALGGGRMHRAAASIAVDLPAMRGDLGDWSSAASIGASRPPVALTEQSFYGDEEWRRKARETLRRHFEGRPAREPIVTAGAIASSDRLIKDTEIMRVWLRIARHILAVEMESAGVYRAASDRVPTLSIRGISDIIGFRRDPSFTSYACQTAAAFTRALLRARPIEPRARPDLTHEALKRPPATAGTKASAAQEPAPAAARGESGRKPEAAPRGTGSKAVVRDKIFISVTEKDRDTLEALKEPLRMLEEQGLIKTWDATRIRPGEVIAAKTAEALASAKIAVLLVSSNYLASKERAEEVVKLLSAGVPLLCLYIDHSLVDLVSYTYDDPETGAKKKIKLMELSALNNRKKPLKSLSGADKSEALMEAVTKIVEAATPPETEET
jgi:nucleoside phosphorylase